MPEYSANGLTLRWSDIENEADGSASRVILEAMPASPGNVMRLFYSVDGGPERVARGWQFAIDSASGWQRFAADLPPVKHGSKLAWRPVLTNGPRDVDPGLRNSDPAGEMGCGVESTVLKALQPGLSRESLAAARFRSSL